MTLIKDEAAFDLPREAFKGLQDYVRRIMEEAPGNKPRPYYPSHRHSLTFQRAYALFVLAMDGDLEAIQQIGRFDTLEPPRSAQLLLAAALAMNTADTDRVSQYLAGISDRAYDTCETDATLNSPIRNEAIELLALSRMQGSEDKQWAIVEHLREWLMNHRYGSTQQSAFVITALARFYQQHPADVETASAEIKTPEATAVIARRERHHATHQGPGSTFTVTNTGQTDIYVDWTCRGIPKTPPTGAVKEGMSIERHILSEQGARVNGTAFVQGNAYIIDTVITCNTRLNNIIVADLLPAGFEVENPRLDTGGMVHAKLPKPASPSFLELRDDRVITAYDGLSQGTHHFYYIVRAVTPGAYQYPAIQGECMYDSQVRARSEARTMEVKGE